jgi:hypothetical protein
MSILDTERDYDEEIKLALIRKETSKLLAKFLAPYNAVRCFATEKMYDILKEKIEAGNEEYKERTLLSVDCRTLCKGDAYGWLKAISEGMKNGTLNKPILVIENVDQIPDGDRNIYDDPQYVENILVRSWKNELINIGDFYLDRREISVIVTCSPDNQTRLGNACRECSFPWCGDFEEWLKKYTEIKTKKVEEEFDRLFNV